MGDLIKEILPALPNFFSDLIEIFSGPKSFLISIDFNTRKTLTRAVIFLGVSTLVTYLSQIWYIERWKTEPLADFFEYLVINGMTFFFDVLLLKLAWRLAGGKAEFKKLVTFAAYEGGAGYLIGSFVSLLGAGVARTIDPTGFPALVALDTTRILETPSVAVYIVLIAAFFYILFANIWLFLVWGAFREINEVPRLRSAMAFVLYYAFSIPFAILSAYVRI
ncbi:hypothetical protein [Paraburkholderia sediminicola]